MKWLYLFLFVALNYVLSTQLFAMVADSEAYVAALIILMMLLGLIVKIRSKRNHPRIYAFAWGMFYGNILSLFLLVGYFVTLPLWLGN